MQLLLPPPAATFQAVSDREATKVLSRYAGSGMPIEFVRRNLGFEGVLNPEYYHEAMRMKKIIEERGGDQGPRPGDLVRCSVNGVYYPSGHLDRGAAGGYQTEHMSICLGGSVPFVCRGTNTVGMSASGGPWRGVKRDALAETTETVSKLFWCWGGYAGGGRGIYFNATVRVWTATLKA